MALSIASSTPSPLSQGSLGVNRPALTRASQALVQQTSAQTATAGQAGLLPTTPSQPLTSLTGVVSSAFTQIRTARVALASAEDAKDALHRIEPRLRRMRELAIRASETSDTSTRDSLAEEFDRLQFEVNEIGERTKFSKKTVLSILNGTKSPALSGTVRLSGAGTIEGRTFTEDFRLLQESAVAATKGIINVEVSDTEISSNFVSIDQKDGRITATRSDTINDGTVRVIGSQTVDARKLQGGIEQGQVAILDFEAIGLKTTLDDRFSLGNLDQTSIRTDRLTGEESDITVGNRFTFGLTDQTDAKTAANALDAALVRAQAVERDLALFQKKQSQTIQQAFTFLGGIAGRGRINIIG
jgi:flagellin-like hook-associated protein FlgL